MGNISSIRTGGTIHPYMTFAGGTGLKFAQSKKNSKEEVSREGNGTGKKTPFGRYTVGSGYKWYQGLQERKCRWAKLIWSKTSIARHSFTAWMLLKQKLPVSTRLKKYIPEIDIACDMCNEGEETLDHLFFTCAYVKNIWNNILAWLKVSCEARSFQEWTEHILG